MTTKVIAAFPGTGKTFFASSINNRLSVIDLDSSSYTRGHDANGRVVSPDFPANYIEAIKDRFGQVDILFVSIHKEVIGALLKEGMEVTLVYPDNSLQAEYIERFRQRRSPRSFLDLFTRNWDVSLGQLRQQKDCRHIVLKSGQYISDIIDSDALFSAQR